MVATRGPGNIVMKIFEPLPVSYCTDVAAAYAKPLCLDEARHTRRSRLLAAGH